MSLSFLQKRKNLCRSSWCQLIIHNPKYVASFHYKRPKQVIPRVSGPIPKARARLPNDPEFFPNRTSLNRFEEHYLNTLAEDLMILTYRHSSPHNSKLQPPEELSGKGENPQVPENPYKKGFVVRPKPPRKPKLFPSSVKSVPELQEIHVHCMMKDAVYSKQHLMSGLMAMQAITSQRPTIVYSKNNVASWKLREGMPVGCKVVLKGLAMYTFLDKFVEIVLPRLKEWYGLPEKAGDGRGNIGMGVPAQAMPFFPDIEPNIDMYPVMTGFDILFNASAKTNLDCRMLMSGFGIPFKNTSFSKKKSSVTVTENSAPVISESK
ncbi:hypothetical protein G9A89_010977 [Geosiphon pyriformis]|nr:hypothetical protein G9A89_010977 [Geosiphon pyriformis]